MHTAVASYKDAENGWATITFHKEFAMMLHSAIGIDPSSDGFQCAYLGPDTSTPRFRSFTITAADLQSFVEWVHACHDPIIAIEGIHGMCRPIEQALAHTDIPLYSFGPFHLTRFRQSILGNNKNNCRDAEAVASYALFLASREKLDHYRNRWIPNESLRSLTRLYREKRRELTREINRLWKRLHAANSDIYLACKGQHPHVSSATNLLRQRGFLRLIAHYPDVTAWYRVPLHTLTTLHGSGRTTMIDTVRQIRVLSPSLTPMTPMQCIVIQSTAAIALSLSDALVAITRQLEQYALQDPAVRSLLTYPGIGVFTASTLVAEIIDIRRFPSNHHLASYAGLARREHKTGLSTSERRPFHFNHHLKNALYTAAKNVTLFNPDSHLAGFYRALRSRGLSHFEVYKRVARALIRRFYRDLRSVTLAQKESISRTVS